MIFIIGMPRSGTTLVSNLINASNQAFIGEETHFFELLSKWNHNKIDINFNNFFFDKNRNLNLHYLNDQKIFKLQNRYYHKNKEGIRTFFLELINFDNRNNLISGEKTPNHYKHIEMILSFFPDAKFVFVERDYRDVYLSQKKIPWGIKNPLLFYHDVLKVLKFKSKYLTNSTSFFSIRYENLLSDTKGELIRLFDFLNISYDSRILKEFNSINYLNFDSSKEPWKKKNVYSIDQSNFGKWKNDKTADLLYLNDLLVVNNIYDDKKLYYKSCLRKFKTLKYFSMYFFERFKSKLCFI